MHFTLPILLTAVFLFDESVGRKPAGVYRIVGGQETSITEHPHQISLEKTEKTGYYFCGGSIIHPQYILTAAHCTQNATIGDLSVRAGSSFYNKGGTIVSVSEINCHPSFNSTNNDYDLCLLKLTKPLQFSENISAIQLPSQGEDIPPGMDAIATGWGILKENGSQPIRLHEVVLPTLSHDICKLVFPEEGSVTDRMTCAGYPQGGKDTCEGDSGGPLVLSGKLIGITTWGDYCAQPNSPAMFTKVSYFVDFINSKLSA